jgi:hypothetical protein
MFDKNIHADELIFINQGINVTNKLIQFKTIYSHYNAHSKIECYDLCYVSLSVINKCTFFFIMIDAKLFASIIMRKT